MYQKFLMRCCPQKRIRVLYVVADKTNVRTTTYAVKHQVNIGGDETFRTKMHERKTYTIPEKTYTAYSLLKVNKVSERSNTKVKL